MQFFKFFKWLPFIIFILNKNIWNIYIKLNICKKLVFKLVFYLKKLFYKLRVIRKFNFRLFFFIFIRSLKNYFNLKKKNLYKLKPNLLKLLKKKFNFGNNIFSIYWIKLYIELNFYKNNYMYFFFPYRLLYHFSYRNLREERSFKFLYLDFKIFYLKWNFYFLVLKLNFTYFFNKIIFYFFKKNYFNYKNFFNIYFFLKFYNNIIKYRTIFFFYYYKILKKKY